MTNWTEVAAIATAVAAGTTSIAAAVTAWMARETRRVAEATRDAATAARAEAEASQKEAEATLRIAEEAQTDRRLAYQPVLSAEVKMTRSPMQQTVKIVNVGVGPAIDVVYAAQDSSGAWCMTNRLNMSANEVVVNLGALNQTDVRRAGWFSRSGRPDADLVLFCRDVLGNRYRFLIYGNAAEVPEIISRDRVIADPGGWWTDPVLWPLDPSRFAQG